MIMDVGRDLGEKWNCGMCGRWGDKSRLTAAQCGTLVCSSCRRHCEKCHRVITQTDAMRRKGLCDECRPKKKARH